MSQHNEAAVLVQAQRRKRADELINNTDAYINGLRVPEIVPRYLGLEMDDSNPLWGYFENSLPNIAACFEESDTDGIYKYRVRDLDTDKEYVPVFEVKRFIGIGA